MVALRLKLRTLERTGIMSNGPITNRVTDIPMKHRAASDVLNCSRTGSSLFFYLY
jgi:hypothetical protein